MSLTLFINNSDSHCECSFKSVDPYLIKCPTCKGQWTHLSSDYGGSKNFEQTIKDMRPDLVADFQHTGFWDTDEGDDALKMLREELNVNAEWE